MMTGGEKTGALGVHADDALLLHRHPAGKPDAMAMQWQSSILTATAIMMAMAIPRRLKT